MPKPNPVRPRMVLKNPIAKKQQILEEIDRYGREEGGRNQWKQVERKAAFLGYVQKICHGYDKQREKIRAQNSPKGKGKTGTEQDRGTLRERERQRESDRERKRERVCVCV